MTRKVYRNRGEMLDHMVDEIWSQGIWLERKTNKKIPISRMTDDRVRSVVGYMIGQAISAAHFKIFTEPNNLVFKFNYANNFENTIRSILEKHPIWKHLEYECKKRNIKLYIN